MSAAQPLDALTVARRCMPGDEAELHARFDAARRGEWFWPTADLLAYVLHEGGDWEDW